MANLSVVKQSKVEKEKMRQKIDLNLNAEIRKKFWFAQSKRE